MKRNIAIALALITLLLIAGCATNIQDTEPKEEFPPAEPPEVTEPPILPEEPPEVKAPEDKLPDKGPESFETDVVYITDNYPLPDYIRGGIDHPPWEDSLYLATSTDGLTFTREYFFIQHAGVPHLMLTDDNFLIATFQYFSYTDFEMFDIIAYITSYDFGETWSMVRNIPIEGLPMGPNPVDPTLVQLDDGSFRLYFTFHQPGNPEPTLFSAKADTYDGVFISEGQQLKPEETILDPAVIKFNNQWHHYTTKHGEPSASSQVNVHSTSPNGLNFMRQDDIIMDFQMLGDVIEDNGKLRFYGTGEGVVVAESTDGNTWTTIKRHAIDGADDGADPGVAKLPDNTYIIAYTKIN